MSIGLERGVVRLAAHSADWAQLFEEEASRLRALVGAHVLDIQHVGSTAISGIVAKPIIDIGIAIARFEDGFACVEPIESLGYVYKGERGVPGRRYFSKGEPRTHHIHMLKSTSKEWRDMIAFRDSLRAHPEQARAYARLKEELARRYPRDRAMYTEGKTAFIASILQRTAQESIP